MVPYNLLSFYPSNQHHLDSLLGRSALRKSGYIFNLHLCSLWQVLKLVLPLQWKNQIYGKMSGMISLKPCTWNRYNVRCSFVVDNFILHWGHSYPCWSADMCGQTFPQCTDRLIISPSLTTDDALLIYHSVQICSVGGFCLQVWFWHTSTRNNRKEGKPEIIPRRLDNH